MTIIDDTVPEPLAGDRVDRVVALISDKSRSAVARMIDNGAVFLDGAPVTSASTRVAAGQQLRIELPVEVDPRPIADPKVSLAVVYCDDDLIVVDKPADLVVHPGAGNTTGTLVHGLLARFPELADVGEVHRPGIVHRLDRNTSGLLMVARTQAAYTALVDDLSHHGPDRRYTALVWGSPESDKGTIDAPIGRSSRYPTRMTVTDRGRPARTNYEVDERFEVPRPTALLRCSLQTGRTHQIRVHLRAIGHPVVGDRDYDGGRPGLDPGRPFLHASSLRVSHPITGEELQFVSELPDELAAMLAQLRVDNRRAQDGLEAIIDD